MLKKIARTDACALVVVVLYRSMARAKAAQAMQGPSRSSVHNSCASLTLFSVGTFFDWEGGGK